MNGPEKHIPPPWTLLPIYVTGGLFSLAIAFTAFLGIAGLVSLDLSAHDNYFGLLGSSCLSIFFLCMIFVCAIIMRHTRRPGIIIPAMFAAMVCSMGAASLWIFMIWVAHDWHERGGNLVAGWAAMLMGIAFALIHNGAFSCLFIRSGSLRIAVRALIVCVWLIALPLIGSFMWYVLFDSEMFLNILAPSVAFFTLIALLASGILSSMIRRANAKWEGARDSVSDKVTLSLECPKCSSPQTLRAGLAKCTACGVPMHIELEEPRCECGYLIYKLTGTTCPECGRDLSEKVGTLVSHELRSSTD